jgi:hypothetical protein
LAESNLHVSTIFQIREALRFGLRTVENACYYLFDLFREYLDPPLRGYQLVGDEYVPALLDAIPSALNGHNAANDFSQSWRLKSEKIEAVNLGLIKAIPTQLDELPKCARHRSR